MFFNDYTSFSGSAGGMRLLRGWTLAFAWSIDKPFSYRTCWFCVQASKEDVWRWFISVFKSRASDPGASGETVELYQQAKMLWVQARINININVPQADKFITPKLSWGFSLGLSLEEKNQNQLD